MAAQDPFSFPEIYSFPPFFTLQDDPGTREKQLSMWVDLVVAYHRASSKNSLKVANALDDALFRNRSISRGLSETELRVVLDETVRRGFGVWVGDDGSRNECLITWKPFASWADSIYKWAEESNAVGKSVNTVYELRAGDGTRDKDFFGIHSGVLVAALRVLEARGKAVLIPGSSDDEMGVKFLP